MSTEGGSSSNAASNKGMTEAQCKLYRIMEDAVTGQINVTNQKVDRLLATQQACASEMQAIKDALKASAECNDMTDAAEEVVRTLDESIVLADSLSQRLMAINSALSELEDRDKQGKR